MTKSRLTILILSVIALVALTGVLVYESCLPGKVSSEHSDAVSDAVIDATENIESVVGGGGESTPDKPSLSDKMKDNFSDFTYYVRKGIGHFGAFLVLAVFATLAFLLSHVKPFPALLLTIIYGFFFATFTESLQLITPGRAGAIKDVLLDFSGYLVGTVITLLVLLIIRVVKKKKLKLA